MGENDIDAKLRRTEQLGIRLEVVGGLPIWEPYPIYKHQKAVDCIRATITPITSRSGSAPCACIHASDIYISFPDGSLKRPDISIFRREPEGEEEAVRLLPEAVIEVVSRGHEVKDLEVAPPFYLSQGVKDVVVFNPYTMNVTHIRRESTTEHASPVELKLLCGCHRVV